MWPIGHEMTKVVTRPVFPSEPFDPVIGKKGSGRKTGASQGYGGGAWEEGIKGSC